MSQALNATGRPILYSMCNWGEDGPWNFAVVSTPSMHRYLGDLTCVVQDIANSWRISGDIYDVSLRACSSPWPLLTPRQNFDRFDHRCPCTSMLDCKLPGFRESPDVRAKTPGLSFEQIVLCLA